MKKKLLILIIICVLPLGYYLYTRDYKDIYIDAVLNSKTYASLPVEAKNFIKNNYYVTGDLIRVEGNKKEGIPYLNPEYIEYMSLSYDLQEEISSIPQTYVVDYYEKETSYSDISSLSYFNVANYDGKSYISEYKNQDKLGVCWAMTSVETAETYLMYTNNESYLKGTSNEFSVRQIDYGTSSDGLINNSNNYFSGKNYWGTGRKLGSGSNFEQSSLFLSSGLSLTNKSWEVNNDKGYKNYGKDLEQLETETVQNFPNSLYELTSSISVPTINIATLDLTKEDNINLKESYLSYVKNLIAMYGSAYVGTISPQEETGAYVDSFGKYIIRKTTTTSSSGHAMQIIGWDDDYEYKYCSYNNKEYVYSSNSTYCNNGTIKTGTGVWILRNSWGNNIKNPLLTYDSLYSDINFISSLTISNSKTWDNFYAPDNLDSFMTNYNVQDFTKTSSKEKLEQIKFITENYNGNINIYYSNNNTYQKLQTMFIDHMGLYTVDLSSYDINVTNNNFKIKITSDNIYTLIGSIQAFTSNTNTLSSIYAKDIKIKKANTIYNFNIVTNNISDGSKVTYKLSNNNNETVNESLYTITEDTVSSNQVISSITFSDSLKDDIYYLDIFYNDISYRVTINCYINNGTIDNPIKIKTIDDLYDIREDMSASYILVNDLDLTNATSVGGDYYNEGLGWIPIGTDMYCEDNECESNAFSGTFDGNNHTIKGLKSNHIETDISSGLFYIIGEDTKIKNIIFEDFDITSNSTAGIIASKTYSTSNNDTIIIDNVVVTNSSIHSPKAGGLFGVIYSDNINITNTYISASIDASFDNDKYSYLAAGGIASRASFASVNIENVELNCVINGYYNNDLFEASTNNPVYVTNTILNNYFINDTHYLISENHIIPSSTTDDNATVFLNNVYSVNDLELEYEVNVSKINTNTYSLEELNDANYDLWTDFENYYTYKNYPILKNAENTIIETGYEYAKIDLDVNETLILNDHITPDTLKVKKLIFTSNETSSYTISNNTLTALSENVVHGQILNLYDGSISNININIIGNKPYIKFDSNGGTDVDYIIKEAGENITKPLDPIKPRYKFLGWFEDPELTQEYIFDKMPSAPITLYAKWEYKEYNITFDLQGGENHTTSMIKYHDEDAILPSIAPYKYGSNFRYWSTNSDGSGNIYYPGSYIYENNNLDLFAVWDRYLFNVNITKDTGVDNVYYKINGGNYTILTSNTFEVNKEDLIYIYATSKEGYIINNNVNETNPYSVSVVSDINYEFSSKLKTYTISYHTDSDTTIKSQTKTHGENITLSSDIPVKEGYKFLGYSLEENGTVLYQNNSNFELNQDTILYANWEKLIKVSFILRDEMEQMCYRTSGDWICADHYTYAYFENGTTVDFALIVKEGYNSVHTKEEPLTKILTDDFVYKPEVDAITFVIAFNLTGGTGTYTDLIKSYFDPAILPDSKPTRNGYKFVGWAIEENGTVVYNPGDKITNNGNLELFAVWEIITYDLNITVDAGVTVYYKKKDDLNYNIITQSITVPVYYGEEYIFYAETNETYNGNITCTINNKCNVTIIGNYNAVFSAKKKTYNIIYDLNGGTSNISNQVKYHNVDINLTKVIPTKKGYVFECWSKTKNGDNCYNPGSTYKDNNDITLYAKYKAKEYTINVSKYTKNGSYIYAKENTVVSDYLKAFSYDSDLTVKVYKNTTQLSLSDKIGTGTVIKFYLDNTLKLEYTNIIIGDINGDGKISSADYVKVRKHIMNSEIINNDIYFKAADVNKDNKISSADYVKIRKYIMNGDAI